MRRVPVGGLLGLSLPRSTLVGRHSCAGQRLQRRKQEQNKAFVCSSQQFTTTHQPAPAACR
eukprot:scaffold8828_cov129-Isochrysis_galbana.AAC.2